MILRQKKRASERDTDRLIERCRKRERKQSKFYEFKDTEKNRKKIK